MLEICYFGTYHKTPNKKICCWETFGATALHLQHYIYITFAAYIVSNTRFLMVETPFPFYVLINDTGN